MHIFIFPGQCQIVFQGSSIIDAPLYSTEMFLVLYILTSSSYSQIKFCFFVKLVGLNVTSLWSEVKYLYVFIGHLSFPFYEMSVILSTFLY